MRLTRRGLRSLGRRRGRWTSIWIWCFGARRLLALGEGEQLKTFVVDCDLWGLDFVRYARRIVAEVLSVGRAGSLVLPASVHGRLGEATLPGSRPWFRFGERRTSWIGWWSGLVTGCV